MNGADYVHGYSDREAERLSDQARTLTSLLHYDTRYPAGSRVLEAGCGTGAETVILSKNSPVQRLYQSTYPPVLYGMRRHGCGPKGSPT